jgi:CelD/BcsL family acetyltransferase involved in cellulose biosynthesis
LGELFARVLALRGSVGGWHALRQPGPVPGYHTGRLRPCSQNGHEALLTHEWTSWYAARRSLNTRKNDRYRERRLAKEGEVEFIEATTPAQAVEITRFGIRVKQRQLAGKGIRCAFDDPGVSRTFLNVAGMPQGPLRAFMLQVNGTPVSAVICLVGGGRCCYVISSYQAGRHDALSPGAVLLRRVLEWACGQSLEVFDFTIGDESYKFGWADRRLPLYYAAGGDTVTGVLMAGGVHLLQMAEHFLRSNDRLLLMSQRVKGMFLR